MKNDNLSIRFSLDGCTVTILKFACQTLPCNMPMHAHCSNSYEIHYIPRGHGSLFCGGEKYDLHPGILCTAGPHVSHAQFLDPEDPLHEYCVYLNVEVQPGLTPGQKAGPLHAFLRCPFWYGTDNAGLASVLDQIRRELEAPGYGISSLLEALFLQLIICTVRNYERNPPAVTDFPPVPLLKGYILIEDSFLYEYDTITLEELSRRLGVSPRQTGRILLRQYGKNFIQKRTEARMAAAAAFLMENQLSISEISGRLGYSCPNHFHAAFKKYYHQTAARYRRELADSAAISICTKEWNVV